MKFRNLNEGVSPTLIFRGVGDNHNTSEDYYGGKFYADNPVDASNYGGIVQVYSLAPNANLFKYNSSLDFCEDNDLMFVRCPLIRKISGGEFLCLKDAIDPLMYDGEDPNLFYAMMQGVAKDALCREGYAGAEWADEDELIGHQYQIWDDSVLTFIEELDEDEADEKYS